MTVNITSTEGQNYRIRTPLEVRMLPVEKLDALIEEAEAASFKTCYVCGAVGVRRSGGWIVVACDHCFELHQASLDVDEE